MGRTGALLLGAALVAWAGCTSGPGPGSELNFSSVIGGSADDGALGVARGPGNLVCLVGATASLDFPTLNSLSGFGSDEGRISKNGFVTLLDPASGRIIFSSALGGRRIDEVQDCVFAPDGSIYVTGKTISTDFPTLEPFQAAQAGRGDAFLARFAGDGTLLASSYLGGTRCENLRSPGSIDLGPDGTVYIAGTTASGDFPTVNPGDLDGRGSDAFLALVSVDGRRLLRSGRIGGKAMDFCFDMALDPEGRPCLVGQTASTDFPTAGGGMPFTGTSGYTDAFVILLDSRGEHALYSGFLGGSAWDFGHAVGFDGRGDVYVGGLTTSPDFPTRNAFDGSYGGGEYAGDVFLTRIRPSTGEILSSTFFGGTKSEPAEAPLRLDVTPEGRTVLAAATDSDDIPIRRPLQARLAGASDLVVAVFAPGAETLEFSTYLGGESYDFPRAVRWDGPNLLVAGNTLSPDFPTRGPLQRGPGADGEIGDAFISGITVPPGE
ncbi:MAG TPA: hypothetical protein PK636_07410 [bacterium]|nr:hypothetical protein [bacterium]HPJ72494.1 hypothetical protein [bacterium]HPQ65362.1 hypothetical protein [bacterium]